jgi:hypothetical protein
VCERHNRGRDARATEMGRITAQCGGAPLLSASRCFIISGSLILAKGNE